jgi:hypothetical protein
MNFVVGELVELKETIKKYPLQQTKTATFCAGPQTISFSFVTQRDKIIVLKTSLNISIFVLVNGQAGWLPISVVQKIQ